MDEWLEAQAAGGCMYYGFYAGNEDLQNMLIHRAFPKQLGHRDPSGCTFLYPALMFLRKHFRRRDICVASGYLPQRAKDLNPEIEDDIGEPVLILSLFPLEEEAYLDRMTQEDVDELAELMGKKPTWWRIAQLMPSI